MTAYYVHARGWAGHRPLELSSADVEGEVRVPGPDTNTTRLNALNAVDAHARKNDPDYRASVSQALSIRIATPEDTT